MSFPNQSIRYFDILSDRYALLLEYICFLRSEAIRREQDCQLFTSLASVF